MGARSEKNDKAAAWTAKAGPGASHGTFASAASHGEILFNCTAGLAALDALQAAGAESLGEKILIDVTNPLVFAPGVPPSLLFAGTDSLGERIQHAFPRTRVVKTLNTITAAVMVDPGRVPGDHDVFMSGDEPDAKARVSEILRGWFGWKRVRDRPR